MSSDDFDGSPLGSGSGPGADEQGAGALDASGGSGPYPAPEGWSNDGVWRDSAMDSNYETNVQRAIRQSDPPPDPGYSYWADGKGWERKPGSSGMRTHGMLN